LRHGKATNSNVAHGEIEMFRKFLKGESGVTAIEYGLIAGILGVALIVVLQQIGGDLRTVFTAISTGLNSAAP